MTKKVPEPQDRPNATGNRRLLFLDRPRIGETKEEFTERLIAAMRPHLNSAPGEDRPEKGENRS
jgi:hypothetical protein